MKTAKYFAGALVGLALASAAQAQAPASLEGKPVYGDGGVLLGHVERVILRENGTPAQVLVQPHGPKTAAGPRSLSFAALRPQGDGLSAPLTRAEFNAMPAVSVPTK